MLMEPIAVSALHNHIVSLMNVLRASDERFVFIADIAGKDDFLRTVLFRHPDFYGGRPQKMAYIGKTYLKAFLQFNNLVVIAGYKMLQHSIGIVHRIGAEALPIYLHVLPFCSSTPPLSPECGHSP